MHDRDDPLVWAQGKIINIIGDYINEDDYRGWHIQIASIVTDLNDKEIMVYYLNPERTVGYDNWFQCMEDALEYNILPRYEIEWDDKSWRPNLADK